MNIYRIIDAEINRVSEGLRLIEDIARFTFDNKKLCSITKEMRHKTRKEILFSNIQPILSRDSENDVGLNVSKEIKLDEKNNLLDLMTANFKRIQEGLRSIEETLKIINKYKLSKVYEQLRFDSYKLEKSFYIEFNKSLRLSPLDTEIYCITAEKFSNGRNNIEVVKSMINAGIKVIQYREKEKALKEKLSECIKIRQLTKDAEVTFIINDDITLAQIVDADGIHLGQDDLPLSEVRSIVGEKMILGLSTHNPEQALKAVEIGADYIGVGPIYKTYTKDNVCDPVGYEYLEWVVENIELPFVAIGGIKLNNLSEITTRKAKCIAMVTEIVGAENIEKTIKQAREIMINI